MFNATPESETQTVPALAGSRYALHPVQAPAATRSCAARRSGTARSPSPPAPWRSSSLLGGDDSGSAHALRGPEAAVGVDGGLDRPQPRRGWRP